MLDAYIINQMKREREKRDQEYDKNRPRVEVGLPDESVKDDREERYNRWREQQIPKPQSEYGPVVVDLDIAKQYQVNTTNTIEGCL